MEKARAYEEPEWARVEEVEEFEEIEEDEDRKEEEKKELYCVACGKKFKSDKQWKNHEQSKKHKEKVAELRKTFEEEDFEEVAEVDEYKEEANGEGEAQQDMRGHDECKNDIGDDSFASAEDDDDEIEEKFRDSVRVDGDKSREEPHLDEQDDDNNTDQPDQVEEAVESNDESSILESMLCGRKNKKHVALKNQQKNPIERDHAQSEDEMEPMEYNNKKGKKKSRRAKKEKGKVFEAEATRGGADVDTAASVGEDNGHDETHSTTDVGGESGDYDRTDDGMQSSTNPGKQPVERKSTSKKDAEAKLKNSAKGRKQKGKSKNADPVCEKCGEEFESRTKLFKHLSDTGHASLKSR